MRVMTEKPSSPAAQTSDATAMAAIAANPPAHILLVCNDGNTTESIQAQLSVDKGRYQLDVAESYEQALDMLAITAYDMHLVDYSFEQQRGVELIRVAIEGGSQPYFILLLDDIDVEASTLSRQVNVLDIITVKNILAGQLEKILSKHLKAHQHTNQQQLVEESYQAIIDNIDEFIYIRSLPSPDEPYGHLEFISKRVQNITGYLPAEFMRSNDLWQKITHIEDQIWLKDMSWFMQQLQEDNYCVDANFIHHEIRVLPRDGNEHIWLDHKIIPYFDSSGVLNSFIGIARDITNQKLAEDRLRHDALHDELTGLPNRALFLDRLQHALLRGQRKPDYQFAALFIDLDRFKNINDVMGHIAGDQLLKEISQRLIAYVRPADTIARLGGDEFAVLLEDIAYAHDATFVANRLQDLLAEPIMIEGSEVFTTASIGIALSTTRYNSPEDMLRDADTALYKAKEDGRARYELFDNDMRAEAAASLQLETDLRKALERNELSLCYQPIIALQDNTIQSVEALLRWQHPGKGLISPADFIPIAEETGLIVDIGYWVIREACKQIYLWKKMFALQPLSTISINLSARQFSEIDLIEHVDRIISSTGVDPSWLTFEITESVVMENAECINAILAQFKSMGISLAMDDFGTGYSSLSYLHRLPIDEVKIDRSFISRIGEGRLEQAEIVDTIIKLTHNMNLKVVAEGVETASQSQQLLEMACDYAQGFYFSPPVGDLQAEQLLRLKSQKPPPHKPS